MSDELKLCDNCRTVTTCLEMGCGQGGSARSRTAPVSAPMGQELPPIEYDKSMDRTYIPLPGGWEIQTKGNGSTFRIAHAQQQTRWQVLEDRLHEPLEAMARDTRNMIAQYAERIRQLEAAYDAATSLAGDTINARNAEVAEQVERIRQLERELAERKTANIDTPEFRELLGRVQGWRDGKPIMSPDSPVGRASQQLIAYIDGRTAGTAPDDLLEIGNRMATTLEVLAAALKNPDTAEGVRCTVEEWHAAAPTPMNSGKEEG